MLQISVEIVAVKYCVLNIHLKLYSLLFCFLLDGPAAKAGIQVGDRILKVHSLTYSVLFFH